MTATVQEDAAKGVETMSASAPVDAGAAAAASATPAASLSPAEAARARAAQLMSDRQYVEARKALEEAERLEAGPLKDRAKARVEDAKARAQKVFGDIGARFSKKPADAPAAAAAAAPAGDSVLAPVERSMAIVKSHSKVAAAVGLLPGGLVNFAAVLAVQGTMIWKIANEFGHNEGKDRIRGSILALLGSVLPMGIGQRAGLAIAAIPAALVGGLVYFVATPILAYATTQAVGNAYIMHFESGGTLLTFDPKAFADHFVKEFQKAGGTVKTSEPAAEPVAAPVVADQVAGAPAAA